MLKPEMINSTLWPSSQFKFRTFSWFYIHLIINKRDRSFKSQMTQDHNSSLQPKYRMMRQLRGMREKNFPQIANFNKSLENLTQFKWIHLNVWNFVCLNFSATAQMGVENRDDYFNFVTYFAVSNVSLSYNVYWTSTIEIVSFNSRWRRMTNVVWSQ